MRAISDRLPIGLPLRFVVSLGVVVAIASACANRVDTTMVPDLEYETGQTLDVYSPTSGGPWPLVVLIHGAGLERDSYRRFAELLAGSGAVVFNVDWRVTTFHVEDSLGDVACAVRYAKDHALEFGGDPKRTVLVGHSTGAVYAGEVATNGEAHHGDCVSTASALTEGLALIAPAQVPGGRPWSHQSLGLNPGLRIAVIHGLDDDVASPRLSVRTSQLLEEAGYQVSTTFLDGGHYDLVLADSSTKDVAEIPDDHPARVVAEQIIELAR